MSRISIQALSLETVLDGLRSKEADRGPAFTAIARMAYEILVCVLVLRIRILKRPAALENKTPTGSTHWHYGSSIDPLVPGPYSASCLGVARSVNEWSNTGIQGLAYARPRLRAWGRMCSGRLFNDTLSLCRTRAPGCPGWSQ